MAQVRKLQLGLTITHYDYNNRQQSSGNAWGMVGSGEDTMNSRLLNYATSLKTQTEEIANLYAKGNTRFHNLPKSVESYVKANQDLDTFIRQVESGQYTKDPITGYNALIRIAGTILPDSEAPKFKEYFLDYLPKKSQKEINIDNRKKEGYNLVSGINSGLSQDYQDYLTNKKINLLSKDGNLYAYNEDYSSIVPLQYLNLDWRNRGIEGSSYNNYLFTDPETGLIYKGNYNDLTQDNPLYDAINQYRDEIVGGRSNLFNKYSNINTNLNYIGDSKLLSQLSRQADLKNIVDVSQLFKGNKLVVALNVPEVNEESGTIEFSPDTVFYTLDNNGNLTTPIRWDNPELESILGKYNPDGWKEAGNQIGSQLKGIDLGETTIASDLIKNPQEWANRMLDIMSKSPTQRTRDDIKELEKYGGFGNPKNILSYISALLQDEIIKLEGDNVIRWHNLTKDYRTASLVEGLPELTNTDKDKKLLEEANKAGYASAADYLGSLRKGFSTTEIMRLSALAADLASLGASFAPGAGTVASGALGLGASGTTFAADIMDDGFQLRDLGNLGLNITLDAVGLLPGGKSLKITKNAVKTIARTLPLLLGIWQGIANGDKYAAVANKLVNGDIKNMTALDWQTLGQGLMLATGTVRTGKATYGAYRSAGKKIKSGVKKGYNAIAEPIKHEKAVRDRAKRISEYNKQHPYTGSGYRSENTTTNVTSKPSRTSDPYMVEEKQGGKLDRFGEYLKSHK